MAQGVPAATVSLRVPWLRGERVQCLRCVPKYWCVCVHVYVQMRVCVRVCVCARAHVSTREKVRISVCARECVTYHEPRRSHLWLSDVTIEKHDVMRLASTGFIIASGGGCSQGRDSR